MELARILSYGDLHLSSKNYGAHNDYPKETLDILKKITEIAKEVNATHIIGLGDVSFGRFGTLEYREAVENELTEQSKICDGRHYELKGNHDSATYGMTEYEYYVRKGLIKPSRNMDIGQVSISMVDYGEYKDHQMNIKEENVNIVFGHDFYSFKDANMPNFGKAVLLDEMTSWYGADHVIAGHIHKSGVYEGLITRQEADGQTHGHRVILDYPGSMSRPAYQPGATDEVGHVVILTIHDDGTVDYDRRDIELLPLDEAFNLTVKEAEKAKEEEKKSRVDISDIVSNLDTHERNIGNPEDIIMGLENVADKYKNKAIELLKLGEA